MAFDSMGAGGSLGFEGFGFSVAELGGHNIDKENFACLVSLIFY